MSWPEVTGRLPVKAPRKLRHTLLEFTLRCLLDQPKQVSPYANDYFEKVCLRHTPMTYGPMECLSSSDEYEEEEEEEESIGGEFDFPFDYPVDYEVKRGNVVYSEPYNPEKDDEDNEDDTVYPKTEEELKMLNDVVPKCLLFRALDKDHVDRVINVMFSKEVEAGDFVIKQFDDGDYFYVIEHGLYDVWIAPDKESEPVKVFTYQNTGTFGELALMYNMPRSATIQAATKGKLWAMDRMTFRKIVLKAAFKKRKMYEELIDKVTILQELTSYERMNLADALSPKEVTDGTVIINQGDSADGMYFIESGEVDVYIYNLNEDKDVLIKTLGTGSYFGELALINQRPRAATVVAKGDVKLAFLDKEAFERILGPCLDIMKRDFGKYKNDIEKAKIQVATSTLTAFGDQKRRLSIRKPGGDLRDGTQVKEPDGEGRTSIVSSRRVSVISREVAVSSRQPSISSRRGSMKAEKPRVSLYVDHEVVGGDGKDSVGAEERRKQEKRKSVRSTRRVSIVSNK